jgi:hypothetical protein
LSAGKPFELTLTRVVVCARAGTTRRATMVATAAIARWWSNRFRDLARFNRLL